MKKILSTFLSAAALLLLTASVPPGHAQTATETRVMSSPSGPWFTVDGTLYYQPLAVFWPIGSQHTLSVPSGQGYSYNADQTIQWQFQGWQWSGGSTPNTSLTVTADPSISQYTATYASQYLYNIQVSCPTCSSGASPGSFYIENLPPAIATNPTGWITPGGVLQLQAGANLGFLFVGWQVGTLPVSINSLTSVTVNAPITATALFVPAKTINFVTNPPNLQIYVDHTLLYALANPPAKLQWALGSTHAVAGLDLQQDINAKQWVFASWSDGGAESHNYVVGTGSIPETLTATYAAAATPFFTTSPPNLNLVVDNLTLPPPYSYIWGVGSTHTLSAPTTQIDSQGNAWIFKSWDDLVTTPTRTVIIPVGADVNGYRLTALYSQQAHLTVNSTIAGQVVTVDGTACTTPCSVVRASGTQVHVSAAASVPLTSTSRQDLLGWSTGGATPVVGDWIATISAPNTSIAATYHLMNSLAASSNPINSATWNISPTSPDGFYDSQTQVSLAVTARTGFRFTNWTGDLSGSSPTATLSMSAPHSVVAQFTATTAATPTTVSNAAGATPQAGVAPGSIASIFGANLTTTTAVGPASPMVQTLAGVSVTLGTTVLPLYFASPAQINMQIPPAMALGPQTVTVAAAGAPNITSSLTVVRDAPGIFPMLVDGQTYALVLHQDGSLVTDTAPAKKGELLTLYGTGFGPTNIPRPDGLAIPVNPPYLIVDPVTVQAGASSFTPVSSFAAPGQVGLDLVQFRLDSTAPSGAAIPVYVTVNGINSNTLNLPIQ